MSLESGESSRMIIQEYHLQYTQEFGTRYLGERLISSKEPSVSRSTKEGHLAYLYAQMPSKVSKGFGSF